MWKGLTGSLGPCGGGGIAGMVLGSPWRLWAARVYRAAVMIWWARSSVIDPLWGYPPEARPGPW